MRLRGALTFALAVLVISAPAFAQDRPQIATELQAAETIYKISTLKVRDGSIQSIDGVMSDRSYFVCDGFRTLQKIALQMYPAQGGPALIMRIGGDSWVSSDGLRATIRNLMIVNDQKVFDYTVAAEFPAAGKPGKAVRSDNKQSITLPAGTVFLPEFLHKMLAAAGSGKSSFEARVFDGDFTASTTGLKQYVATIGAPRAANEVAKAKIGVASGTPAWPIELSMYDPSKPDSPPDVQNGFSMLPNGMSETILMDIQTAKLRLDLDGVKLLPKPDCSATKVQPETTP